MFLGKFPNWDFKHNIFNVTLKHHNQCINLCQEIVSWAKYPEELKCSPVSSSTTNSAKSSLFFENICVYKIHSFVLFCSRDFRWVLLKAYWQYISREVFKKISLHIKYKRYDHFGEKIGFSTYFYRFK